MLPGKPRAAESLCHINIKHFRLFFFKAEYTVTNKFKTIQRSDALGALKI
jgi:hypothetical protein